MSKSSMRERNKAIREAWEREIELVSQGKGTRDWTQEQQRDILDPNKGRAYDADGRAFEGQHMKSVAKYPVYQGDPNNIQFLTRDEHFAAHKGNWQNPTNWYYNPEAKSENEKFVNFEEDELIPCKIIYLSNPIMSPITETQKSSNKPKDTSNAGEPSTKQNQSSQQEDVPHDSESTSHRSSAPKSSQKTNEILGDKSIKSSSKFHSVNKVWKAIKCGAKKAVEICVTHPKEIMACIALVVGGAVINAVSEQAENGNGDSASNIDWSLEINNLDTNSISANDENSDTVENLENGTEDDCRAGTPKRPHTRRGYEGHRWKKNDDGERELQKTWVSEAHIHGDQSENIYDLI